VWGDGKERKVEERRVEERGDRINEGEEQKTQYLYTLLNLLFKIY
jgi:hypothetical protein